MTQQVFAALTWLFTGASLVLVSALGFRSGDAMSLWVHGRYVEREKEPVNFWISWSLWVVMGVLALAKGSWIGWQAVVRPDPTPASGWYLLLFLLAVVVSVGAIVWVRGVALWRRGPPWNGGLRRERELGKRIRSLADDRDPVYDFETREETLDVLLKYSDFDFLERIAAHLASQSPPRSLRTALEALDSPPDDASS